MRNYIVALMVVLSVQSKAQAEYEKAVLLGDSIVSNVHDGGSVSQSAPWMLSSTLNMDIRNLGSAANSLGAVDHTGYNNPNITAAYDVIRGSGNNFSYFIVQAGTNDWGLSVDPSFTKQALQKVMTYSRKYNKKVLMLAPIYRQDEGGVNLLGLSLNDYRMIMYTTCKLENPDICRYASKDKFDGVNHLEYYATNEVANSKGIHLNAAGHYAWALWVGGHIVKMRNGNLSAD
jgi:lysophospholipase L1-like esterase